MKAIIPYLKLIHGSYNIFVMSLLIYQGMIGIKIRMRRKAGEPQDFLLIKKHRKNGPVFALMGCIGYLTGITIIYLDKGRIVEYALHFIIGSTIAFFLTAAYLVSKKIKGIESPFRTPHFIAGLIIFCLYPVQIFFGIGILF